MDPTLLVSNCLNLMVSKRSNLKHFLKWLNFYNAFYCLSANATVFILLRLLAKYKKFRIY